MYRSFKMCGERGVILNDGAVVELSALALKMLDHVKFPIEPNCPSALRYALAKYDSGDVNRAYSELLSVQAHHVSPVASKNRVRIISISELASITENDIAYLEFGDPSHESLRAIVDVAKEYPLEGVIIKTNDVDAFKTTSDLLLKLGLPDKLSISIGVTPASSASEEVIDKFKRGALSVWCDMFANGGMSESELSKLYRWVFLSGAPEKYTFLPISSAIVGSTLCAAIITPELSSDITVEEALTHDDSPELARLVAAAALMLHCEG